LSYHSGIALKANFAVTMMRISAALYITVLLFATRQDRQCTCDDILRGVPANIVRFRCFGELR